MCALAMRVTARADARSVAASSPRVARARAPRAHRPGAARAATLRVRGAVEIAQTALDAETVTAGLAAVAGLGAGLGIPIFFVWQERRDKERLEEIRELNRATLKATGEQMSVEEIEELRPARYLDRREFKDDD
jgi:hypothetical protein